MMKRNILAVVIPALLVAGAANAAEVYNKDGNKLDLTGKITAKNYIGDKKDSYFGEGDQTYARLGFKGETQISSDLTGYGRFEHQFDGASIEGEQGDKTRYAFAGLKFADYGSFDYGRNLGVAYDGLSYTDVLPEFGGDSSYTDNLTGRIGGAATYRNSNFFGLVDGLGFAAQYFDDNESGRRDRQNREGWATSLSYETDIGLGFIGSYGAYNRTEDQKLDNRGDKADAWSTGIKYDANSLYLAAVYGEFRNLTYVNRNNPAIDKTKVFEAVAQYTFDFGLTPSLGYVSAKGKDNATNTNDYVEKYVSLGASYAFNKNFSAYTEYDISLIDKDNAYFAGTKTDDTWAVGLVYQF
ncbi:porin [Pectobacterium odoriferum]|uniref:porin n=1 Tax=Pectobacterium odoriferum TaxID=78398 RepID=UPI000CD0E780|nr:porin [Pectobacterium odoriferum]POE05917.1 porin [Pectobacterium odoriferum]